MSNPSSKPSTIPSSGVSTPVSKALPSGTSGKSAATTTPSTTIPMTTPHGSTGAQAPISGAATPKRTSTSDGVKPTHPPQQAHSRQTVFHPKPAQGSQTSIFPKTAHLSKHEEKYIPAITSVLNPQKVDSSENHQAPKKNGKVKRTPCPPHLCTLVPTDVPAPGCTQAILHPRKDVFVLKVAKVGPHGDRRCRMELELVTPKAQDRTPPYRVDTRETQCDPECTCCCSKAAARRKTNKGEN
ncbi:hypothetical protein O0L34_g2577 [Tuta absoluta]|nr:hypothetical protein O0L34_g2577 [Tuta absoluta]